MQLKLNAEEIDALLTALNSYYTELRSEISHTESYELRQSLKHMEMVLAGVLDKLEPGWAARHGMHIPVAEPLLTQ